VALHPHVVARLEEVTFVHLYRQGVACPCRAASSLCRPRLHCCMAEDL